MLKSFLTCRPNRYQGYTSMDSTSDISSSSETLSLISEEECIPRPTVLTDLVQPEGEDILGNGEVKVGTNRNLKSN